MSPVNRAANNSVEMSNSDVEGRFKRSSLAFENPYYAESAVLQYEGRAKTPSFASGGDNLS